MPLEPVIASSARGVVAAPITSRTAIDSPSDGSGQHCWLFCQYPKAFQQDLFATAAGCSFNLDGQLELFGKLSLGYAPDFFLT